MLNDYLILGLAQYGLPVLFTVVLLASMGAPLPATLLLTTAGALIGQGGMDAWTLLGTATIAAVIGDNLAYSAGRWGSAGFLHYLNRKIGATRISQAERASQRWGGVGVFLSRWVLTPLGPVLNLSSGMTHYPWLRFLCYDIVGEILWVGLYLSIGAFFSAQAATISAALGQWTLALVGVVALLALGWTLFRQYRYIRSRTSLHLPHTI